MFKLECPSTLVDFYKLSDGLSFNGYQIYSSENKEVNGVLQGIFEYNQLMNSLSEDYQESFGKDYIFFGDGDMDYFTLDKKLEKFQSRDRYSGDVIEEFE